VELIIVALSVGFEKRLELIRAGHGACFTVHVRVYLQVADSGN
jgi:hypothetical protein